MNALTPIVSDAGEAIVEAARSRYSTKAYDPSRRIADGDVAKLKELLRLAPSSVNSQPWHFVIAQSEEGKARLGKAVEGDYAFNHDKVTKASHVVVFASRLSADDAYLSHLADAEEAAGRFASDPEQLRKQTEDGRSYFVGTHDQDLQEWFAKQVYIAVGQLLLGAAVMGIDATPIEGVDTAILDRDLGLAEKGYAALCVVALGYRAQDDFNAKLPKARLPETEVITEI